MSLVTKRTLIVGILYTAIVEGVLASLPFSLRLVTVIYYTRLIAYRSLDFVVTWPGGQQGDIAAATWFLDTKSDPTLAEHPDPDDLRAGPAWCEPGMSPSSRAGCVRSANST